MEATKFDAGKPLLATWPRAMLLVGAISALGKAKYKDDCNFLFGDSLGTKRTAEAALRHIYQYLSGETYDDESSKHHIAHAICELLMLLEIELSVPQGDTRYHKTPQTITGTKPE